MLEGQFVTLRWAKALVSEALVSEVLVEGLSQDVLCDVVNWDFGNCLIARFTG